MHFDEDAVDATQVSGFYAGYCVHVIANVDSKVFVTHRAAERRQTGKRRTTDFDVGAHPVIERVIYVSGIKVRFDPGGSSAVDAATVIVIGAEIDVRINAGC